MSKPRIVFRSKNFKIEKFSFRANGREFTFDRAIDNDVVVVLPILKDGRIIIERQKRHVLGKYIYELPAGHVDKGEEHYDAAIRELEEEIGYTARKMKLLFGSYPRPGSSTQVSSFFVATNLVKTKTDRDPSEVIEVKIITLKKAFEMIKSGQIKDLKTIACILFYKNYC